MSMSQALKVPGTKEIVYYKAAEQGATRHHAAEQARVFQLVSLMGLDDSMIIHFSRVLTAPYIEEVQGPAVVVWKPSTEGRQVTLRFKFKSVVGAVGFTSALWRCL